MTNTTSTNIFSGEQIDSKALTAAKAAVSGVACAGGVAFSGATGLSGPLAVFSFASIPVTAGVCGYAANKASELLR